MLEWSEAVWVVQVDDKYQYSTEDKDNQVHGWICSDPPVGFWMITPSDEFRVAGPIKQDLTSHAGPITLSVSPITPHNHAHAHARHLFVKMPPDVQNSKLFRPRRCSSALTTPERKWAWSSQPGRPGRRCSAPFSCISTPSHPPPKILLSISLSGKMPNNRYVHNFSISQSWVFDAWFGVCSLSGVVRTFLSWLRKSMTGHMIFLNLKTSLLPTKEETSPAGY